MNAGVALKNPSTEAGPVPAWPGSGLEPLWLVGARSERDGQGFGVFALNIELKGD